MNKKHSNLFPALFDNKISAHQHHHSIQHHSHHSPNRRSIRNNNQNTTNSSNFHHAFHDRQRASHRQLFGGGPTKHLSHNPKSSGGGHNNAFRSSLMRSQELANNRFNSDDTHSRFHRARSSPPIHRRVGGGNGGFHSRGGKNWRASHGDLYTMSDGADNLGTVDSVNFQQLGVQGLRSRFSMHDLHAANERRASRSDLRDARDALHHSKRIHSHSHDSLNRNDLRASRRSRSGRKGAELFNSNNDEAREESQPHHHVHNQCSKCAMHDNHHHSPRGAHNSSKKHKSQHHIPHTDVFGPGAFHY